MLWHFPEAEPKSVQSVLLWRAPVGQGGCILQRDDRMSHAACRLGGNINKICHVSYTANYISKWSVFLFFTHSVRVFVLEPAVIKPIIRSCSVWFQPAGDAKQMRRQYEWLNVSVMADLCYQGKTHIVATVCSWFTSSLSKLLNRC